MNAPTDELKYFNVGAYKAAYDDRAVEHEIGTEDPGKEFRALMGGDEPDDDDEFPVGAKVTYQLLMTEGDAERLRAEGHIRFVEETITVEPAYSGNPNSYQVPTDASRVYQRMIGDLPGVWHGQDVLVAVLDQGTTKAVRDFMGFTLVGRSAMGEALPEGQELFTNVADATGYWKHGCYVAPNCVPVGGRLLDVIICNSDGLSSDANFLAGVKYACDNGARLLNYSFGSKNTVNATLSQTYKDAMTYAANVGAVICISNGNDNLAGLGHPAAASRTYSNVASVIAFNEDTDARASFSNYAADATCCSPGVQVASLLPDATVVLWDGTSCASPMFCMGLARGCTGGRFTPVQVLAAAKASLRDTGQPAAEQGGGAFDFRAMIANLQATTDTATTAGTETPTIVDSRGFAGSITSMTPSPPSGIRENDLRLMVTVTASSIELVTPPGWILIRDQFLPSAPAQRLRVHAKPYTFDEVTPATFTFSPGNAYGFWYMLTLRAAGGIDFSRIISLARFTMLTTLSTPGSLPVQQTNDLVIDTFWTRNETGASAGTLSTPAESTGPKVWRTTAATGYQIMFATRSGVSGARLASISSVADAASSGGGAFTMVIPGPPPVVPALPIRRNLCPNPSIETDTSGYSLNFTRSGVTVTGPTRTNTIATPAQVPGTYYGFVNITAPDSVAATSDCDVNLPSFAVTPGLSYAVSTFLRPTVAGRYLFYLRFDDSAGAKVGETPTGTSNIIALTTSTWQRISRVMVAPANAVICKPQMWLYSAGDNTARSFRWDGTLYEQSTVVGDYFDGLTPAASFDGAQHLSASTLRPDRLGKQFNWGLTLAA